MLHNSKFGLGKNHSCWFLASVPLRNGTRIGGRNILRQDVYLALRSLSGPKLPYYVLGPRIQLSGRMILITLLILSFLKINSRGMLNVSGKIQVFQCGSQRVQRVNLDTERNGYTHLTMMMRGAVGTQNGVKL